MINKMDVKMQFGFTIAVSFLICIFAPVENVNNPLSENNRKVNKIRTIVVVLIGFHRLTERMFRRISGFRVLIHR